MTADPAARQPDAPAAATGPGPGLGDVNERLVLESEALRGALAELEAARRRESVALQDSTTLFAALEALSGRPDASAALQALLECLRLRYDIPTACYLQAEGGALRVLAAAATSQTGLRLPIAPALIDRPRRIGRLARVAADAPLPPGFADLEAAILVPVAIPDEPPGGLFLGTDQPGRFAPGDLRLLERIGRMAGQSLTALREVRRNALLVSLIEGRAAPAGGGALDAPLEAVHRAFTRLTEAQGHVVGIQDALLGAPLDRADAAIDDALARMGTLTDMDRVYVFRLRPDAALIDNTHEWCAPGIAAMRATLQGIPADMIAPWRTAFADAGKVVIPDVAAMPDSAPEKQTLLDQGIRSLLAVSLEQDGVFQGFVGYDAVRGLRTFLPGEVHLIRSVAKVIAAILSRRDAEEALRTAHAETSRERARLGAVLAAMPDTVLELDAEARFLACHAGCGAMPALAAGSLEGAPLDAVLPAAAAEAAGAMVGALRAGGPGDGPVLALDLGSGESWWQLSATTIPAAGFLLVLRNVTETRRQTAEIERLSEIARRTTNLVVVTDAERRIEWVNDAFERTTGWRLDEVRGRNPGSLLQSDLTDQGTVARIRRALDAGEAVRADLLNRARDGRYYWVQLHIQPLRRADGTLQGFMSVQSDVTERRRQQEALLAAASDAAQARARLEAAVEALQDGFVLFDAEDRLVICNQRYREIYALSADAIRPGVSFEDGLRHGIACGQYAEAVGREEAWLAERLAQHRAAESEIEQELADGRWVRIFEKATPDGGRVGLRVDITALKLAERRAVADRSAAMEASQDGIALTDAEGRFVYMNRAHLAMFGFSSEAEALGQSWSTLYSAEGAAWMQANAMPALLRDGRWSGEILGRARDGTAVDQDISLTRQPDGGILCITRDMRDRRREAAERERLRAELQLAQRREIIGQIAAGLAHDFNNLLAAIAGSAGLIEASAEPGTPAAAAASRIQQASDQAAELVRRLLTIGTRSTSRVLLDLRRPVREAADLIRTSLRAPARLLLNLPEAPVEAQADPTDLLQLVLNLGINARDALAGEAGEVRIGLAPAAPGDPGLPVMAGRLDPARRYCCLTVADTGIGMAPDLAAQVFRPYFSTKADKGSGLGLAIVGSIVSANGGAVALETQPGAGACFRIFWPADHAGADAPSVGAGRLTGGLDGRAVLVVDDASAVLAVTAEMLEAAGAEVAPSTDPADILEALREDPGAWDLLVTDFDMPGMTGAELALAARGLAPGLPIVLLSAVTKAAEGYTGVFDRVLAKPAGRQALISAAESAILQAAGRRGG